MRIIRYGLLVLGVALGTAIGAAQPASARVNIDINLSLFPDLVPVPGYPVYYAPQENWNYFFYDGMYWVYEDDGWYTSNWYDGPWEYVEPEFVPVYVLRVPVRYYRRPPAYFYGWRVDAPPRWENRWGDDWQRRHRGWDHWDHQRVPARAPLPVYQRDYSGDRYPRSEQQREIRDQHYRYQPHNAEVRKHYQDDAQRSPREYLPSQREERGGQQAPQENIEHRAPPQNSRDYQTRPQQQAPQHLPQRPLQQSPQQPSQQSSQQPPQQPPQQQWQQRREPQQQESQQQQRAPQSSHRENQWQQGARQQPQREIQQSRPEVRPQADVQQRPQRDAERPQQHGERGPDAARDNNRGHEHGHDD